MHNIKFTILENMARQLGLSLVFLASGFCRMHCLSLVCCSPWLFLRSVKELEKQASGQAFELILSP